MSYEYDSSEEKQVKARKKKIDHVRDLQLMEIRDLLSQKEFRAFMWRLLTECGLYTDCFTGNSTTFYKEGKRSIALFLVKELMEADKMAYVNMQLEADNG